MATIAVVAPVTAAVPAVHAPAASAPPPIAPVLPLRIACVGAVPERLTTPPLLQRRLVTSGSEVGNAEPRTIRAFCGDPSTICPLWSTTSGEVSSDKTMSPATCDAAVVPTIDPDVSCTLPVTAL